MSKLKITCTHCGRVTTVDAAKVPDHPVAYRCASCKGKIVIDKKKILAGGAATPESAGPDSSLGRVASAPGLPSTDVRIEEVMLPPGETLPPALLISEDDNLAARLIENLKPYECEIERVATPEDAHRRVMIDVPPLILYLAQTLGPPPFAPIRPLVHLPPRERRQTFITLIGSDAPTLDGNQAFLFQVNMLLNHQHLPKAAGILYSGLRHHQRLYRQYFAAMGESL